MNKFIAAVAVLAVAVSARAANEDIRSIAHAVDEHYNHLSTLEAAFTETYTGAGMERTESGTLWLERPGMKKPGKMRWEYRSPREKLFVSDGKDAWFYVPGDRQARKSSAKTLDDAHSPLAFLLGKTNLEKELRGLSIASDYAPIEPGDVVLRGVPASMADQVSDILVEVTPSHQIDRLIINDVDGSSTEYRFTDQKENVAIAGAQFHFKPPAGTEIVEGDLEP